MISMGRHCKLTPELQDKIITYIKAGNYAKVACKASGICEDTFYDWIKKGENAKSGKFFGFSESIKRARATAEIRNVAVVNKAAEKHWTAAMTWLERKYPERWGNKQYQKVEHSGKVDISIFKEYLKDEEEQ